MQFVAVAAILLGLYFAVWAGILGHDVGTAAAAVGAGAAGEAGGSPAGIKPGEQGGPKGSGPFGLSGIVSAFKQSGWLNKYGGQLAFVSGEANYILPHGAQQGVYLPHNNAGWQLVSTLSDPCAWGIQIWKDLDTGHQLAFLHLSQFSVSSKGQTVPGGTQAGVTGWPLQPACGVGGIIGPANAHLAVVYDAVTARYITGVS